MRNKDDEGVQLLDDNEDRRPKATVRTPSRPANRRPIGPSAPPARDPIPPALMNMLREVQARIDQIQAEQYEDEEASRLHYWVANARCKRTQDLTRGVVQDCNGFLASPLEEATIKLTGALLFSGGAGPEKDGPLPQLLRVTHPRVQVLSGCDRVPGPGRHALCIPTGTQSTVARTMTTRVVGGIYMTP